jgi:hypothetical protein
MTALPDLDRYDGLGLAALVRQREVSAAELLDATIERVGARNPAINAVIHRMDEQARKAIAAGLPAGPFTGVPYLLKDLGALYAGTPTTGGSAFFRDAVADHDSEIVARLKRAGLVIFGKTNTSEFGLSTSVEPGLQRRWVERRRRGGGRRRHVADGTCNRWRRLDPHSGIGLRPFRPEADARQDAGRARCRRELERCRHRPRRDTLGARQRGAARRNCGTRYRRSLLRAAAARVLPGGSRCRSAPAQDRRHDHSVERLAG